MTWPATPVERDRRDAALYVRIGWKQLEMEEQARARGLARKGLLCFAKDGVRTVIRLVDPPVPK